MTCSTPARLSNKERGAVLLIGTVALAALLAVAALVVDLGLARTDRAQSRSNTDAISTAGVLGLRDGGGVAGCESAVGYVTELLGSSDGLACAGFPLTCDSSTAAASTSSTTNGVTVTLTYPVNDNDPMMTPTSGGAQTIVASDGDRCQRFGARIEHERAALFSQVLGKDTIGSASHSVALTGDPIGPPDLVHLLLLEPHQCPVLSVSGGGSSGGVYIDAATDPATGDIYPGRIAIDSDGTSGCGSTIRTTGSHANVHAQGPSGCATEQATGSGWGCGVIETVAPGAPGCNPPACSGATGTVSPPPQPASRPRTRAPFDWRFNCKPVYPASYGIEGCPDAATSNSYIDDLILDAEFTGGFQYYTDHYDCSLKPNDDITVPAGNWFIDCSALSIKGELTFEGGNLIVDGDIDLNSQGVLNVNTNNGNPTYNWNPGMPTDIDEHSDGAAFIYFQDGFLNKSGGATLNFHHTMVYFSDTSGGLDMTGGGSGGAMTWTAPTEGPFKDLALWSESTTIHKLAGSATFALEGVVFAPNAPFSFQGNGGISTAEAQFVAKSLSTGGNGALRLAPVFSRSVTHPATTDTQLIR